MDPLNVSISQHTTTRRAIYLVLLCTLFTSMGQIFWKFGVVKINLNFPLTIFNLSFLLGCVTYGLGAILLIIAFSEGEMSIIYPLAATSYVWVSLASPLFFPSDSMNVWKWIGVIIILISVGILSRSGAKKIKKWWRPYD